MRGISHVAIGVSDIDRSLPFYRDVLGLRVTLDAVEGTDRDGPIDGGLTRSAPRRRRAVYLRWDDGPESTFIVLSSPSLGGDALPLRLDQIGIHHYGFWVDDFDARVQRLRDAGVRFHFGPTESDTAGYGEAPGGKVLTCIFEDPDGILLQFDQRVDPQPTSPVGSRSR